MKHVEDSVKLILLEAKDKMDKVQSQHEEYCKASINRVEDTVRSVVLAAECALSEVQPKKHNFWKQVNG